MPNGDPVKWSLLQRARASFDPERSGDIVMFLKSHIMPVPNPTTYVATHGSPWDYDRRVPIAFWRRGMAPSAPQQAVETADIMPTLAAMLGLRLGAPAIDGHCLAGVSGVTCPKR
jgi:predicted AlkP superfamily pyrophosphatase or phosphodiesterase